MAGTRAAGVALGELAALVVGSRRWRGCWFGRGKATGGGGYCDAATLYLLGFMSSTTSTSPSRNILVIVLDTLL